MPAPSTTDTDLLRDQLIRLIDGYDARMPFDDAVAAFPDDAINAFPPNVDYTPWHLLEHIRITQADILDYIVNRDYVGIEWPTEYWPSRDATATPAEFVETIASIKRDQATLRAIVEDPCDRPVRDDPGHARTHDPPRGARRRRPQRLSHRRVRGPPTGDGHVAGRPQAIGASGLDRGRAQGRATSRTSTAWANQHGLMHGDVIRAELTASICGPSSRSRM